MTTALRVALVEDNIGFRRTMATFLDHLDGFRPVAEFGTAEEALRAIDDPAPWDLVLMDLHLPGALQGIDATRQLKARAPDVKVVVLTVFEDPATVIEAISAGADGYLVKRSTAAELRAQLSAIVAGGAPLTPGVARTLMAVVRDLSPAPASSEGEGPQPFDLTEREQDVLRCIVNGRSYQQAADDLGIGVDTVRTHIRNLYRKLQVHSVAEAVSIAIRRRLL
jgi:DNA-binding NarL/FixJ family response regulator